jgi:PAP2 superfamily
MRTQQSVSIFAYIAVTALSAACASAQTAANLSALVGLAPVSALPDTAAGEAALQRNLTVTGAIQDGTAHQPTLLPFHKEQQQALRDAAITKENANDLADGLGSKLGGAYRAAAPYTSADDGKTPKFSNISPALADLIAYADATTSSDARSAKFFFANATVDGQAPVSAEAMSVLTDVKGVKDVFGKAYGFPAGSKGADEFGDSRPFQTETHLVHFKGKDFFGVRSGNDAYLYGPSQDLRNSPSYPSGHTTYGYTEGLLLAILVPQRYPQMIARAAEYGNDRIIMGAHYAMDVLAGRALAEYDVAQLLANRRGYVGVQNGAVKIDDFPAALAVARSDVTKALENGCNHTIEVCARQDKSRFARASSNRTFYEATQTYGLPAVSQRDAEDVGKVAPEAGLLLTAAFPNLTLLEADAILTETEGPGGGFLDNGSAFGVYSRLDLYRAATKAMALSAPNQNITGERHTANDLSGPTSR